QHCSAVWRAARRPAQRTPERFAWPSQHTNWLRPRHHRGAAMSATAALGDAKEFGWHIFPAPPDKKCSYKSAERSNGARWGATSDPAEIRRDFTRWPNARIG